jgi:hypothetical protein
MNYGGTDSHRVWGPWCERFLWLPTRIKTHRAISLGDRSTYKWMWLSTVYYRFLFVDIVYPLNRPPLAVDVEYAMNIFDILRKGD